MKDSVDTRYALALFAVAKEDKAISKYQLEIKRLKTLLSENVELFNLLKSEFLPVNKRYEVIDTIFKGYSRAVINFLKILLQNHRLNSYLTIFMAFNSLCNEERHVLEGIVYSTSKLSDRQMQDLEKALSKKNRVDVELINRIDPSLIGGIKVVINNHVYDYSMQNEIETMRSRLKA